ncbi:hypothetical protein PN4B1_08320 [Paenibacillus naphthalenovorans]|nr:hypothetical protein PN4B1_08320 [Paenibacillus naphthalenovorans]
MWTVSRCIGKSSSLPTWGRLLYDYRPTRGGEHSRNYLRGFSGYLHVDATPATTWEWVVCEHAALGEEQRDHLQRDRNGKREPV